MSNPNNNNIIDFKHMDERTYRASLDSLQGHQRALQDLNNSPGWKMYQQTVQRDLAAVRAIMNDTIDPTVLARAVGAHKQLTYASSFVETELRRTANALTQAEQQRR